MGSSTRFNYTMMGDNISLAARYETVSSTYSTLISMTTGNTRAGAELLSDELAFRNLDRLVIRGKKYPVAIHQIIGFKRKLAPKAFECIELYEKRLKRYFKQDWDGAD